MKGKNIKFKKLTILFVVLLILGCNLIPSGKSDESTYNLYKNYIYNSTLPNPSQSIFSYSKLDNWTVQHNAKGQSNGQSIPYIHTFPSLNVPTKYIQSLHFIPSSSLNYKMYHEYDTARGNIFIQIQKTGSTFAVFIKVDTNTRYQSDSITIPGGQFITIDLQSSVVCALENGYTEIAIYVEAYMDNGNSFWSLQKSVIHSFGGANSLSYAKIVDSYYAPSTNIYYTIVLHRYGTMNYWTSTFSDGIFMQKMRFSETLAINFKTYIRNLEDLPYFTYLSLDLQSFNILINFSTNYSIVVKNRTDNTISIENRTIEFAYNYTEFEDIWSERQFKYDTTFINVNDWGNWGINGNMNWLRNGFATVLNSLATIMQFLFYLVIIALNYLLWIPFVYIFILFVNYVAYGIVWAFTAVIFAVVVIMVYLWFYVILPALEALWYDILVPIGNWIYQNVILPIINIFVAIYNWLFYEGGLQILFNLYLSLVSYILTTIFFVLTLGSINFTETQKAIFEFLIQLNNVFFQIGSIFINNFPLLIGYSGTYILLVGLVYLKYIYAKARGYTQRATKLQSMINIYKLPMVLLIRLSQYIIGFIQGGVPTDGANE